MSIWCQRLAVCGLVWLVSAPGIWISGATASATDREPLRGKSLAEVLGGLADQGVEVVFTERLVRPDMRVELEPTATEPLPLLNQLLMPHSLRAEPSVAGRFRVVPGDPPTVEVVAGRVLSSVNDSALAGAFLRSLDFGFEIQTDDSGGFHTQLHSAFFDTRKGTSWSISVPGFEEVRLDLEPGSGEDLTVRLEPVQVTGETVEVRGSRPWILGKDLSTLSLRREDLLALPHVGNDVFRSLTLLPGVSSNDASAQLSIRGGREDEVLVRLDGLELLEPYHLRDFNSFLSILSPQIIDQVELLTGGFPAEFGDRMSGVLEMTTVSAESQQRYFGLTPLDAELGGSGRIADNPWLLAVRGGTLELPFRLADQQERPVFGDVFIKVDRGISDSRSARGSALLSVDRLRFLDQEEGETEELSTRYRSSYLWFSDQKVLSPSLIVETRLFGVRIDRDRRGLEREGDQGFELSDDRVLNSGGLSQDWHRQIGSSGLLKWGADVRQAEAHYNYARDRQFEDPLARIRGSGSGLTSTFEQTFRGWQYAGYLSGRFELGPRVEVELGIRFDRNTVLDDNHTEHPRANIAFQLSPESRLQVAWGQYSQSQRLYELPVEDGVTEFSETEQADYGSVGFETAFADVGARRRPLTLRLEAYRRTVGNPRVRFENLFDPISKVPELEADRWLFAPEETVSEGVEVFVGGAFAESWDWFAGYSYADAYDLIDGAEVPRSNDQTHTLRLDFAWHSPWLWDVHFAWRSHTGWPISEVSARLESQGGNPVVVPELVSLNGDRLPDYHRMDLRLQRSWKLKSGSELEVYLQIQNLLGRRNLRGYDVDFEIRDAGQVDVVLDPETWGGTIPSFGFRWRR